MSLTDRINRANARSRRVPSLIFKAILAWVLSGIVMAVMVPMLHARGVSLQPWMAWAVIVAAVALCVGPDLAKRLSGRD